jgi:hypothetical protein
MQVVSITREHKRRYKPSIAQSNFHRLITSPICELPNPRILPNSVNAASSIGSVMYLVEV